jgi:hypothetical protein
VKALGVALVAVSQILVSVAWDSAASAQAAEGPLESAATRWLLLLDQGRFDDAWREGTPLLHQGNTQSEWTEATRHVRERFGTVQSRKLLFKDYQMHIDGLPDADYFTLRYQTSFTDGRPAVVELVTLMLAPDGQYRPVAYGLKR